MSFYSVNSIGNLPIFYLDDHKWSVKWKLYRCWFNTIVCLCSVDGRVFACGENKNGQLGLGYKMDRSVPSHIECLPQVKQVATGYSHSVALTGQPSVMFVITSVFYCFILQTWNLNPEFLFIQILTMTKQCKLSHLHCSGFVFFIGAFNKNINQGFKGGVVLSFK